MDTRSRNLSIRVPWHDAAWNGTVCTHPDRNVHCVEYENIARKKNDALEVERAEIPIVDLSDKEIWLYGTDYRRRPLQGWLTSKNTMG